jgi:ABC-type molybdenum transport system ATPase subunit/photorepair protein PhrA
MSDVLAMAGVGVVRGDTVILDDVSWEVEEGQRWVVLGPNGAGKTTLLQLAAARIHPTTGVVGILGEVLGTVDVFELRPRIGLASAALAERIPGHERVRDVVVTASYGSSAGGARPTTASTRAAPTSCSRRSAPTTSPTGASGRCPRASARGSRSPGR